MYRRRRSASLIIREIQIKTTESYHLAAVGVIIFQRQEITGVDEDVERREQSCTVGGNTGWCSHYGNSCEVSSRHWNWEYQMIQQFHFCVFIQEKRKTNSLAYVAGAGVWGWEVGDMSEGASKGMHSQLSINKTWAVMYSMAHTVNNIVLHI